MSTAIKIDHLIKDFSIGIMGIKLRAVDDLSLNIKSNQIYGLLGPNGSGKSTTLKIIIGLLTPTAGQCEIFGQKSNTVNSRRDIGFMPEAPYFYRFLTGRELIRFYARLCNVPQNKIETRLDEVIKLVGMTHAAHRRIGTYSKGMLQRIGLAQAIVHDPKLIILDEPTAGVDPLGARDISTIIKELKSTGKTILMCSHLLSQVEDICDEVAILHNGKLQACGQVSKLLETESQHTLTIEGLSPDSIADIEAIVKKSGAKVINQQKARKSLADYFVDKTREN